VIEIQHFREMLRRVTPHTSTDTTVPMLCGIHLEMDGPTLYAVASDRYTFAISRHRATILGTTPERWTAFLTSVDLRTLATLRPAWTGQATVLTFHDDGRLSVHLGEQTVTLPDRSDLHTKFPHWRPIVRDALTAEPHLVDDLHMSPLLLARWSKGLPTWEQREPLTIWTAGPNKPVVLARGAHFLGIQMPIRVTPNEDYDENGSSTPSRADVRHVWRQLLTDPEQPGDLRAA
jgi:hypothetical protein